MSFAFSSKKKIHGKDLMVAGGLQEVPTIVFRREQPILVALLMGPSILPKFRPLSHFCRKKCFGQTYKRFSLTRYALVQRALNRNISTCFKLQTTG